MKNKKRYLRNLLNQRSSEFWDLEKKINPDNLIYNYKTEGRSPKDVSVYQNPIELFKNLRHGNINPREVLKNRINLKSNLVEIKTEIQNQDQKIK